MNKHDIEYFAPGTIGGSGVWYCRRCGLYLRSAEEANSGCFSPFGRSPG